MKKPSTFKRLISLTLALLMLIGASISLFSCSETPEETESNTEAQTKPPKEKTELSICTASEHVEVLKYFASVFMSSNTLINVTVINIDDYKLENGKIDSSLFGEDGPDMILITEAVNIDLPDLIQNGSFADINTLVDESSFNQFKLSNLNQAALEAGKFGNKQLLVPLFYSIPVISYIPEYVDDEQIVLDNGFAAFVESAKDYSGALFSQCPTLADIYCYLGLDLIDINSGKYNLNDPKMAELVSLYCTLYSDYANDPSKYKAPTGAYTDSYEISALSAQDILFLNGLNKNGSATNIDLLDSLAERLPYSYLSFEMSAFPGSLESGSACGTLGWSIAVNSKTTKKDAALKFLNKLSDYDATAQYWRSLGIGTYELYNENSKDKLYGKEPDFSGGDVYFDQFIHDLSTRLPADVLDGYYEVFDAVDTFCYLDTTTIKIINSIVEDIQKNGLSIEDALISASDRLAIHMNLK